MRKRYLFCLILLIFQVDFVNSQNVISGKISDSKTLEPLIGANVYLKSLKKGVISDIKGYFTFNIEGDTTDKIVVSYMGYKTTEITLKSKRANLDIRLEQTYLPGSEVVISASRFNEKLMQSPSSINKINAIQVMNTSAADFYNGMANLKDVDVIETSMGFKIFNSRGFNTSSPFRVVQFIDGVDNQAVSFNFPPGNLFGLPDIDIDNIELISGPASAMYGPNALQGVVSMHSKSPYDSKGITVQIKGGTRSYMEGQLRWADVFGKKQRLGVKIIASYMQADEWLADNTSSNVYKKMSSPPQNLNNLLSKLSVDTTLSISTREMYNDFINYSDSFNTLKPGSKSFNMPGYSEKYLYDGKTSNLKLAANIHYKLCKNLEVYYQYRFNEITGIYQGNSRSRIENMTFQQHVFGIKGKNFYVRGYLSMDDVNDSYDLVLTGINLGLTSLPNVSKEYLKEYVNAVMQQSNNFTYSPDSLNITEINNNALNSSNNGWLKPGTTEFENAYNQIKTNKNRSSGGSMFTPHSILEHVDAQYDFKLSVINFNVGAMFRYYMPKSEGRHFLDTLISDGKYANISFYETGGFLQASSNFFSERLKIIASARVDKSENFDVQFSPRAGLIFTLGKHSIRFFVQSAFRNPTLNDQYFNLNNGSFIVKGNLNGVTNLYTQASVNEYYKLPMDSTKLVPITLSPIKPEHLNSIEAGYRGVIFNKLLIDFNAYLNFYTDFIGSIKVVRPKSGIAGEQSGINSVKNRSTQTYSIAVNSTTPVNTYGTSIALSYYLPYNIMVYVNYTYSKLKIPNTNDPLIPGFNTPEHKVNIGLEGRNIWKNFGFAANLRWVDKYLWQSPFAEGLVPSYYNIDAQINYELPRIYSVLKVGVSNLTDNKYIQAYGSPNIGRFIYASWNFSIDYNKKKF